ncbi:hypothetical protein WJX77_005993 [Trebouxia sp. C0004]
MRRSTWDSPSADLDSKLMLEGSNIFPGPHESVRAQRLGRHPLHKHNFVRSNQDTIAQHSNSSVRRSSQGCQPPTPGQLAPHIASWHKQHLQTATSVPLANSRRAQQVPAAPSRHSPPGCDGPNADTRGISGSQPARAQSGLAVRLVPQDRRASWDSQKRLAFTPPASLSTDNRSRRVSLGLPGGGAKQHLPDDSAVRLPPLTPPGTDTGSSAAAAAAAAAHPWLSATLNTGSRASPHIATADLGSNSSRHGSRWHADQCPGAISPAMQGEVSVSHSAQQDADRLESSAAVSTQSSLADDVACSGRSQAEAGVRTLQQQQSQKQPMSQSRLLAAAALDDTGQIGPPITRLRPASIPTNPASARKSSSSSSSKEHAAAVVQTAAEAILVDALLCGWEQHSNDGDLYPLTLALEKEGGEGADLHKLQMATSVQLELRATGPPLPQGSPSRTKAGKPRPRRRWQQE